MKTYLQDFTFLILIRIDSVQRLENSPALCRAERSRRTPVGGHQAARQGGGRRCAFQGVCRSH